MFTFANKNKTLFLSSSQANTKISFHLLKDSLLFIFTLKRLKRFFQNNGVDAHAAVLD